MRAILEVRSGPSGGRRIWLGTGQAMEVGRSEIADVMIPEDHHMSSRHFGLECGEGICRIRDLGSTNGTFVNGERITEATLREGDVVVAGKTSFAVRLEIESREKPPSEYVPPPQSPAPADLPPAEQPPAEIPPGEVAPPDIAAEEQSPAAGGAFEPAEPEEAGPTPPMPSEEPLPQEEAAARESPSIEEPLLPEVPLVGERLLPPEQPSPPPELSPPAAPAPEMPMEIPPSPAPLEGVVLEVRSGPSGERKVWLHVGGSVVVGRTEAADLALPEDALISGEHFVLECEPPGCRIRDLGSANGTFLNGERLAEAQLVYDGDEVRAGQSVFCLHVRGGPEPPEDRSATGAPQPAASPPVEGPAASGQAGGAGCEQIECASGIKLLRGTLGDLDPAAIGRRLADRLPGYMIIDFPKLGIALPAGVENADRLFDSPSDILAPEMSPVILGPVQEEELFGLAGEAWGQDALTWVFSRLPRADLVLHLREVARGRVEPGNSVESQGLTHCWPSAVLPVLAKGEAALVSEVFSGIDAVMVEAEGGAQWGIFYYGDVETTAMLREIGFRPRSA
ncbi:MAG: FHA domain-containing protein [Planctomycetota bacterium]|jgi:pSer/pThr/pTyr-binding forkhead associated (FHA) protein